MESKETVRVSFFLKSDWVRVCLQPVAPSCCEREEGRVSKETGSEGAEGGVPDQSVSHQPAIPGTGGAKLGTLLARTCRVIGEEYAQGDLWSK